MSGKKKVVEETEPEKYYEIKSETGDIYITINAGRGSVVKVNSGEAPPPPRPPKP